MRDVLIGATPPTALASWHYLGVSCLAGVITFFPLRRYREAAQSRADLRRAGSCAVCGDRRQQGAGVRPGARLSDPARHAQRHRRWHCARHAGRADAGRAAFGAVCRCRAGRCVGDRRRQGSGVARSSGADRCRDLCFGLRFMAIRYGWRLPVASPTFFASRMCSACGQRMFAGQRDATEFPDQYRTRARRVPGIAASASFSATACSSLVDTSATT